MRPLKWLSFSSALILTLSGCANNGGSSGNDPMGTGPFDSAGNYHEEWANDPSKWSKPGKRSKQPSPGDEVPSIAQNEQPPPNANPLMSSGGAKPKPVTATVKEVTRTTPRSNVEPKAEVKKSTATASRSTPKKQSSTATVAKTTPKPSSKSTARGTKPKTQAKSSRYVVKSGDSVDRIARRNGVSVSAVMRANNMSKDLIHPGQSLVIPKR